MREEEDGHMIMLYDLLSTEMISLSTRSTFQRGVLFFPTVTPGEFCSMALGKTGEMRLCSLTHPQNILVWLFVESFQRQEPNVRLKSIQEYHDPRGLAEIE